MSIIFTLVTDGPTVGDHDRVNHRSFEEALNALDNLPCEQITHSHVEIDRGDFHWKLNGSNSIFRRWEDMPA